MVKRFRLSIIFAALGMTILSILNYESISLELMLRLGSQPIREKYIAELDVGQRVVCQRLLREVAVQTKNEALAIDRLNAGWSRHNLEFSVFDIGHTARPNAITLEMLQEFLASRRYSPAQKLRVFAVVFMVYEGALPKSWPLEEAIPEILQTLRAIMKLASEISVHNIEAKSEDDVILGIRRLCRDVVYFFTQWDDDVGKATFLSQLDEDTRYKLNVTVTQSNARFIAAAQIGILEATSVHRDSSNCVLVGTRQSLRKRVVIKSAGKNRALLKVLQADSTIVLRAPNLYFEYLGPDQFATLLGPAPNLYYRYLPEETSLLPELLHQNSFAEIQSSNLLSRSEKASYQRLRTSVLNLVTKCCRELTNHDATACGSEDKIHSRLESRIGVQFVQQDIDILKLIKSEKDALQKELKCHNCCDKYFGD